MQPPVAVTERAGEPLEAVVAGLPDPVIALDRNGRVLTLNETRVRWRRRYARRTGSLALACPS